jgi:hypothetical protein
MVLYAVVAIVQLSGKEGLSTINSQQVVVFQATNGTLKLLEMPGALKT